jgi:predicted DNA-binding protein YlxM (UPF0122 family)
LFTLLKSYVDSVASKSTIIQDLYIEEGGSLIDKRECFKLKFDGEVFIDGSNIQRRIYEGYFGEVIFIEIFDEFLYINVKCFYPEIIEIIEFISDFKDNWLNKYKRSGKKSRKNEFDNKNNINELATTCYDPSQEKILLSKRDIEFINLRNNGYSAKDIASRYDIVAKTVHNRISRIRKVYPGLIKYHQKWRDLKTE